LFLIVNVSGAKQWPCRKDIGEKEKSTRLFMEIKAQMIGF